MGHVYLFPGAFTGAPGRDHRTTSAKSYAAHTSEAMKATSSTCLACLTLSVVPVNSFVSGPVAPSISVRLPRWGGGSSSSSPVTHDTRHAPAAASLAGGAGSSRALGLALRMVAAPDVSTAKVPGSADMDWENLGFEYRDGEYVLPILYKYT